MRDGLDRVHTTIWVIRRPDEEHQQGNHRGERHGQERLCEQTLNVEEVRRKDRKRRTDEDHDPQRGGNGVACRFDAPPPKFNERIESPENLRMNDKTERRA